MLNSSKKGYSSNSSAHSFSLTYVFVKWRNMKKGFCFMETDIWRNTGAGRHCALNRSRQKTNWEHNGEQQKRLKSSRRFFSPLLIKTELSYSHSLQVSFVFFVFVCLFLLLFCCCCFYCCCFVVVVFVSIASLPLSVFRSFFSNETFVVYIWENKHG